MKTPISIAALYRPGIAAVHISKMFESTKSLNNVQQIKMFYENSSPNSGYMILYPEFGLQLSRIILAQTQDI